MKIAVITTHYANNYGALLQTYALQKFLNESLGQDAEALAYYPPWHKVSWSIINKPKSLKDFFKMLYILLNIRNKRKFKARARKNKDFINSNIRRSQTNYYCEKEIIYDKPKYNCYICGSDQIWNLRLMKIESVFFLNFTSYFHGVKKIAYAPSITESIPEEKIDTVRRYLKNIDAISVREDKDVQIIQSLTDKPVYHVLDPVFLLRKEEWNELSLIPKIKQPYILCYFISSGDLAEKAVKKLRELTEYPVVHINVNARDKFHSDYDIRDADPLEFIGYINKATLVCTNSFHCTAFSMIFKKDYFVIPKSTANSRIESLHNKLGIQSRFLDTEKVSNLKTEDFYVDYSKFDDNYEDFRKKSIDYLINSLGEDE